MATARKTPEDIKKMLISNIFIAPTGRGLVFESFDYGLILGKLDIALDRESIIWKDIPGKHSYSIAKKGAGLIFRTYDNEISTDTNEFSIKVLKANTKRKLTIQLRHNGEVVFEFVAAK